MPPTFYILHGNDTLGIEEALKKLRAEMGDDANADMNISEFDGTSASVPEVINAVSSFPFLADKRMAIVKGMITWITRRGAGATGKNAVQRLQEDLPHLPDYARLVFVEAEALSEKNPLVKLTQTATNGYIREFNAPKDATSWILQRVRDTYALDIDQRAATALAAVTGDDLRRADNEIIKLVSYLGEEDRPINEDDVATLTPYVPEANIFKMVDAIAEGRGELALHLLHRLLADKDQDPFSIYGMIIRQFRLLLLAKEHLLSGGSSGSIAKAIGVRAFVAQNLARQARGFSLEDLERIYRNLGETDFKMKTGQIKPDLALDLFIATLAR